MRQECSDAKIPDDITEIADELEIISEIIENDVLEFHNPLFYNFENFPLIDFDVDEYFAQPPSIESLPDDLLEIESNYHEILSLSLIPPARRSQRDPIEVITKQLHREELKAFERYIEESTDEDPYGLERLFQEN